MTAIDAERARALLEAATAGDGATAPWHYSWLTDTRDPPHGEIRDADGGHVADVCDVPCSALIAAAPDLARAVIALTEERDRLRAALTIISAIRDDIVGRQSINWSAHIYPLVAALGEAGFEGVGYDVAREKALTADAECDKLRAERDAAIAERDAADRHAGCEEMQDAHLAEIERLRAELDTRGSGVAFDQLRAVNDALRVDKGVLTKRAETAEAALVDAQDRIAALEAALTRIATGYYECGHCTRGDRDTPEEIARAALGGKS